MATFGEKVFTHTVNGVTVQIHLAVNEHDTFNWREAMFWASPPVQGMEIRIDYLKLWRDNATPKINQVDAWVNILTYTPSGGGSTYTTDWATNCDASDDWKAEMRYKLRRGGQTSPMFTKFSDVHHTSC